MFRTNAINTLFYTAVRSAQGFLVYNGLKEIVNTHDNFNKINTYTNISWNYRSRNGALFGFSATYHNTKHDSQRTTPAPQSTTALKIRR